MTTRTRIRTFEWQDPMANAASKISDLSGLEFLSAIVRGEIPQPPIADAMDFHLAAVENGRAVFRSRPQEFHYNPIGSVHGGYYGTLLDSCMSCAVHSTLDVAAGYTTLEYKINLVRGLREEDGEVSAEGTVVHRGRRIATAEGRITDASGKLYAHGTATCLIMQA